MKTLVQRQNPSGNLVIQRFVGDDEELDDVIIISEYELYLALKLIKGEIQGDWSDVVEYLEDRHE